MKKLTDRERAAREHARLVKLPAAKRPETKARRLLQLEAAYQRSLPNRKENLKTATFLSPQGKRGYLSGPKYSSLDALRRNNLDIFFRDLKLMPELLKDDDIWEQSVDIWLRQKFWKGDQGKAARKNLKRIGSTLADIEGRPEYKTQEEREEANRTNQRNATKEYRKNVKKNRTLKGAS
jgi:hypothetical protein